MKIATEHLTAIQTLGYTADEARFLYIAATHSGYFVPRQFLACVAAKWGKRSDHFVRKLESRGHAGWREYSGVGGVYHLYSKTLYRVIDKESLRNCRRHSTEFIRTRLVLLDFVLTNQTHNYLETEPEKTAHFCERLRVPKSALPAKTYAGSNQTGPAVRYFVDRFPLFLDASDGSADPTVTFSYVDAGEATLAGLVHHLQKYKELLAHLKYFRFILISNSSVHFIPAERYFSSFASRVLEGAVSDELSRYFRLRSAWDQKQYEQLSNDDVEWLERADDRFRGQDTERHYAAWRAGQLTDDGAVRTLGDASPPRRARFSTYLVRSGGMIAKELEKAG
jgi:hypothetical protein